MPELPITEPPETLLEEPAHSLEELAGASSPDEVAEVAAHHPQCLAAWAALGEEALDSGRAIEAYAYFRVGYHRGLDRLRGAGWRGQGRVPWVHEGNRGFLRSLRGLGKASAQIGESDEAERCADFLSELAPDV